MRAVSVSPISSPAKSIVVTEIDGDLALYDPRRERVLMLNHTASAIWCLIDGTKTIDGLAESLATAFDLDPESIREEVISTVERFANEGFLSSDL